MQGNEDGGGTGSVPQRHYQVFRCSPLVKSAPNDSLVLDLIKEVRLTLGGRELMGTNERGAAYCVPTWQPLAAAKRL